MHFCLQGEYSEMYFLYLSGENKPIWMRAEEREENKVETYHLIIHLSQIKKQILFIL